MVCDIKIAKNGIFVKSNAVAGDDFQFEEQNKRCVRFACFVLYGNILKKTE